ncbi:MAG: CvpA family protein [Syntrophales bacterium LBB04]|nr:CvpA family protein [Syntrophales bacterium LBB04]
MFDIIVLAFIGILTIVGFWKGMVKQLFGLAGVVAGYVLALRYYQPCSKFLTSIHPGTARVISFIAIVLACMLVAHLIGWGVGRLLAISQLGFLNRIGGGLLGFLKGCIIVSLAVMAMTLFLSADNNLFKKSSTIKYIQHITGILKKVTRGEIEAKYDEKVGKEKPVLPSKKGGKELGAAEPSLFMLHRIQ